MVAHIDAALDNLVSRLGVVLETERQLDVLVERSIGVFVDFATEHRHEYLLLVGRAGRGSSDVGHLIPELPRRLAALYVPVGRSASATPDNRQPPEAQSRLIAHALIALCEAVVHAWLEDPAAMGRDELIELVKGMLLGALRG